MSSIRKLGWLSSARSKGNINRVRVKLVHPERAASRPHSRRTIRLSISHPPLHNKLSSGHLTGIIYLLSILYLYCFIIVPRCPHTLNRIFQTTSLFPAAILSSLSHIQCTLHSPTKLVSPSIYALLTFTLVSVKSLTMSVMTQCDRFYSGQRSHHIALIFEKGLILRSNGLATWMRRTSGSSGCTGKKVN